MLTISIKNENEFDITGQSVKFDIFYDDGMMMT